MRVRVTVLDVLCGTSSPQMAMETERFSASYMLRYVMGLQKIVEYFANISTLMCAEVFGMMSDFSLWSVSVPKRMDILYIYFESNFVYWHL